MLLYRLLIGFLRLINHLYFVEVRAVGRENVPDDGPVLLAANHPSSILDSVLISTQIPRPIHYLARSGLFRIPVLATFFRQMGAIPIYRSGETKGAGTRNQDVFRKVYELFETGGCVGIFPEGKNSPYGQVGDIRSGAARMALGAEARNDFQLGLKIIPAGINFEDRELLTAAVLLRFGQPIRVADYADLYREKPDEAIRQLTRQIQKVLRRQALHIEDYRIAELASELGDVFGTEKDISSDNDENSAGDSPTRFKQWMWTLLGWYGRSSKASAAAFEKRMRSKREIIQVLSHAYHDEPELVEALRGRIDRFKDHVNQVKLTQMLAHSFEEPVRERLIRVRMTLYAILMAPVALFGLLHNVLPYLVTKLTAQLFKDEAVRGFTYFVLGLVTFGATYSSLGIWLWQFTDLSLTMTIVYIAALPPSGFAALTYRRNVLIYRDKILVRTLFWNNDSLVKLLREERQQIINQYQALAERYSG